MIEVEHSAEARPADNLALRPIWVRRADRPLEQLPAHRLPDVLCELNVLEQVSTLSCNRVIQRCWSQGNELQVHGWIYDIHDGILRDLGLSLDQSDDTERVCRAALEQIKQRAMAGEKNP